MQVITSLTQLGVHIVSGPALRTEEDAQDTAEAARERRRAGSMTEALSEALSDVVSDADGTAEDAATAMPDGLAADSVGTTDADVPAGDGGEPCVCLAELQRHPVPTALTAVAPCAPSSLMNRA